jgi:outer membrane protein, heavy metal efflux system
MRGAAWLWSIALLMVTVLSSAVAADPLRLTMDEAVARAIATNAELGAARRYIDIAKATLDRSKVWFPANPFVSGGAQRTSQSGVGANYVFLLSQEIEIAGQRSKRIEAATAGVDKANADNAAAEQTLAAAVKTAYVQALLGEQHLGLAQQGADAVTKYTESLSGRRTASDAQQLDLNNARIQETRAQRAIAELKQTHNRAFNALRRLLRLPIGQEIELAGAAQTTVKPLPASPELLERALRRRPDLAALRHEARRAVEQVALSKRERVPNVTVTGSVSHFEGDSLAGGDIGVPLPLFNRHAADVNEAVASRDHASLQAEDLERRIAEEVSNARDECEIAADDVQSFQSTIIPLSEENLRLQRRLSEHGKGHDADADAANAEIDLFNVRGEYVDALLAYNEALIELERVTGGPID